MLRLFFKSAVKGWGSTIKLPLELEGLSVFGICGMRGVAVKCIDSTQNSDCEGRLLSHN